MIAVIAAAALLVAVSVLIGGALARLCGMWTLEPAAPACGLSALVIVSSVAIRLPGRAITSAVFVLLLILGAAVVHLRLIRPRRLAWWAVIAALLAGIAVLLPFLASGRVGIFGVGTNDDMVEHLLGAWTLQGHL